MELATTPFQDQSRYQNTVQDEQHITQNLHTFFDVRARQEKCECQMCQVTLLVYFDLELNITPTKNHKPFFTIRLFLKLILVLYLNVG